MYQYRIFIVLVTYGVLFPSYVSISDAEIVARNLYNMRKDFDSLNEFKVESIEMLNKDLNELIYLFHLDPHGFIMVSADDRCIPVLAYSFNNPFELELLPPNVLWVVEKYIKNLLATINSNREASELVKSKWDTFLYSTNSLRQQNNFVEPLITARFDQDGNWNNECPTGCGSQEALVGCVAVSMGQIMHYWRYPIKAEGDYNYTDPGDDDEPSFGTFQGEFTITYDYVAMGDGTSSSEAAALLLYDAGVSVNMDYGCDESGAYVMSNQSVFSAQNAFVNYFMFDDNITSINRDSLTDDEFMSLLTDELDNNRPVIYMGYDEGTDPDDDVSGHAWNCDGYDEYGLFHMNWGWGGSTNGYFDINALTTSGNTFSAGQSALIGIQPQVLNLPNLKLDTYFSYETSGDGDVVINPGETFEIIIELENLVPWAAASSIELVITTEDKGVNIDESASNIYSIETLHPGETFSNVSMPFIADVEEDIELGDKLFNLIVIGTGIEGAENNFFYKEYELDIDISLNQSGFPVVSTAELRASPLVIDLDGDGDKEIIIGDNNGFVHIYNADGSEVEDDTFPYDTGGQIWGSAAAADMDRDGFMDFVITSKSKHLYIFDQNGIKTDYNANKYLMGTPAIGNLDGDADLEVVVGGYSSSNQIFAINPDGSDVDGFPFSLGEKTKAGVSLADFNGNSKDDIILGTDDDNIYVIYDDGTVASGFPYTTGDKIQAAPSVADIDGEKIIFSGSNDNSFYAVNSDGSLRFSIETGDKVQSSPSFLDHNGETYIFFGSNDNMIYAVDSDGNALAGWPIAVNGSIGGSVVFSDLDGNGNPEIVAATDTGNIIAFHLDGSYVNYFPITNEFHFSNSPVITQLDTDGDLEIIVGSGSNLFVVDIKELGNTADYWNMYRGGNNRRGINFVNGNCTDPSACNYDSSANSNDGSCYYPSGCDNICGSDLENDECGVCGGDGIDADNDSECDNVDDCVSTGAEYLVYDVDGNEVDAFFGGYDECGFCNGNGCHNQDCTTYPSSDYGCDGTILSLYNSIIPDMYSIHSIYPNPFNPATHIRYSLPENTDVRIIVYNILGKQIEYLANNFQSPGFYSIVWDASRYPSGIYFIIMEAGIFRETRKVILIK